MPSNRSMNNLAISFTKHSSLGTNTLTTFTTDAMISSTSKSRVASTIPSKVTPSYNLASSLKIDSLASLT